MTIHQSRSTLLPGFFNADVSRGGMHLQRRSASVQLAVGMQSLWPPIAAFAAHMDLGEIRSDAMSIAHIHAGTKVETNLGGNVNRDVSGSGFEIGIVPLAGIYQLHRNPSGS